MMSRGILLNIVLLMIKIVIHVCGGHLISYVNTCWGLYVFVKIVVNILILISWEILTDKRIILN
jgi:hypothetical protein